MLLLATDGFTLPKGRIGCIWIAIDMYGKHVKLMEN